MNVRMGSTKAQICRDLRDFVKFCNLALHPPKMEWIWTCENMDAALERFQSTAQSAIPVETQFNQEFKKSSIVSVDQVKECFFKIKKLLVECFDFLENEELVSGSTERNVKRYYRHLQSALIFGVINRNVCRKSTAMYLQKSFLTEFS